MRFDEDRRVGVSFAARQILAFGLGRVHARSQGKLRGAAGRTNAHTSMCGLFPARCEVQGAWREVCRASVSVARATRTLPWAKARAGGGRGRGRGRGPGDELSDMDASGREAGLAGLRGNAASGRARVERVCSRH